MNLTPTNNRFSNWIIALFLTAILLGTAIWGGTREHSVPAGFSHVQETVLAAPNNVTRFSAGNFVSEKHMSRGYCYASTMISDHQALGGFGKSHNIAKAVHDRSAGKGLYLFAQPALETTFQGAKGMRVCLVNKTSETLSFSASDSRLSIIQEAKDTKGTWRPIEYLPSSWCGNSFHRVFLKPNYYWAFPAPRYRGEVPTQLRFALRLGDGSMCYSNTFSGSINPEQFTMKQGYNSNQLMDPYEE